MGARCCKKGNGSYERKGNDGRDCQAPWGKHGDGIPAAGRQKDEAAVFLARVLASPNPARRRLRLKGLIPNALYEDAGTGQRWPGDVLCQIGLPAELPDGDFAARVIRLRRV